MTTRMEYVRQMPGRIVGRTARSRRAARLHADAAGARAAHPPRQGDLQHLHQPGPAGDRGDDLHVAAGAAGPGAHRRRLACAHPRAGGGADALPGVRRAFAGPYFHEAVLLLDRPVAPVLDSARGARHPRRPGPGRVLPRAGRRAAGVRHRDQDREPTSSATSPRSASRCRPRAPPEAYEDPTMSSHVKR